jgi:hypothetical protein
MCSQHPNSSHLQPSHARQAACGAAICRPRELLMRKTVFLVHPLLRSDRTWGWPCIMVRGSSSSAWCPTPAPRASIYICAPRAQRRESPPLPCWLPTPANLGSGQYDLQALSDSCGVLARAALVLVRPWPSCTAAGSRLDAPPHRLSSCKSVYLLFRATRLSFQSPESVFIPPSTGRPRGTWHTALGP